MQLKVDSALILYCVCVLPEKMHKQLSKAVFYPLIISNLIRSSDVSANVRTQC